MTTQAEASRSTDSLRVAALQMVSATDVDANLRSAERLIAEAAAGGAQLIALPEYFVLLGRNDRDKVAIREADGAGPLQSFLAEQAARHGVWLVGGTVPLVSPHLAKVMNSTLVYAPDGRRLARYDKIHLFGFRRDAEQFDESATIVAGRSPVVFDVDAGHGAAARWRVGLSVCYDLRFPELYRALAPTDLLLVPSAFTYTTGSAHWEILLRTRAIENQCYVLAPAQGGRHENGRRTWGHSMLIDPWGDVLGVRDEGEGVVIGDLHRQRLTTVRAGLPALSHRVM
ncbi:MAG: carbon-nitrogen hydrolase family protein [Burkholderiales bacterium]|nr:carbon-nitrogen hydrolase family protein [Burkholderiales bacterium]ODU65611.1 MAG: acyltransferase [Lautropia sp. SCN 66-9]